MQTEKQNNKNRLYSLLQKGYARFLKIRGHPHEIALGLALGLFVAMTPTMGFQMAIAICIATFFKLNKVAAGIGVWVTNPVTAPIIYPICYYIGSRIYSVPKSQTVGAGLNVKLFYTLLVKAPELFIALTIGGVIIGLPLAVAGYYFAYSAIRRYQDEIKLKLAQRKEIKLAQRKEKRAIKAQKKRKKKKHKNKRKRRRPSK
ncbi:DUF2062 domain-containing protein [Desulfococcaceae bacterium HSG7]|nr:DUF2062 domain-containing protein [Desulfococcaceae bacterium HSG7]